MDIRTVRVFPSIPTRWYDWCSWEVGNEDGQWGYGKTEEEAIQDLRDQREEVL